MNAFNRFLALSTAALLGWNIYEGISEHWTTKMPLVMVSFLGALLVFTIIDYAKEGNP
jgi:hypothetical protein